MKSEKDIFTLVDGGKAPLKSHRFASENLNKEKLNYERERKMMATYAVDEEEAAKDVEQNVHFRLNQTGNIFYSTTSSDSNMQEDAKKLFKSVTVLFAAMTKAMHDKGKDLFDYDAWSSLIGKTGYFVEVQKFQKNLEIKSNELSIDTQVVQQILPGLTTGNSMDIAKSVLNAINGKFGASSTDEKTKFGHILFICEELMGAPSVTVRLFFASKASHTTITQSPCHKTTSKSFSQAQDANTFLFVSPDTIAEFAGQFVSQPQAYENLIKRLSGYLESENPKPPEGNK